MLETKNAQKRIALCFLAFATLCEILVTFSYERGILAVQHYVGPVCFVFLGMTLMSGRIRLALDELVALAYPLWYFVSRLLLKELYLDHSFYPFCSMILVYGLAFPFARWAEDHEKKSGLCIVAVLFGSFYGMMAWLGVYAAISSRTITLPYLKTTLALTAGRLEMSTHPNVTACIFFAAFVLVLWLMMHDRRRITLFAGMTVLLGLYLAISLTNSRTIMIQLSCATALMTLFILQRLKRKKSFPAYLPFVAAVAVLVLTYLSFEAALKGLTALNNAYAAHAETIVVNRKLSKDLLSMNSRTDIYRSVFTLISDHPDVLLRGLRENEYVAMQNLYGIPVNTHNAWLQTLLMTGVPGLAFALWFTVRAVRLFLTAVSIRTLKAEDQFLLAVPLVLLVNGITESYVFTELKPYYNFAFFLLLGYALEIWRRIRTEKRTT